MKSNKETILGLITNNFKTYTDILELQMKSKKQKVISVFKYVNT